MAKLYPSIILLWSIATFGSGDLQAQRTVWPLIRDHGRQVAATYAHTASEGFRGDPIWSDDFSDPAHWTFGTLDSTAHNWVIGSAIPGGVYPMPAISSTSAANGYALFDSGLPCGPDNGYVAIASPIDLGAEAHVQLQFEQFYRKFQGHTYVDVSNDGSTWTPFEVNVQLNVGQYTANAELFRLDISSVAALQDSVWFRFRYVGNCDYAWMVDDVALVQQPAHELQLVTAATTSWDYDTNASFDSVYYSNFPISQVRWRAVNMVFFNAGYLPATNVVAQISTSDGYDQTTQFDVVAPGDSMVWFAEQQWYPSLTWGDHYIYYSVGADDPDMDMNDNLDTLKIHIDDFLYSRDDAVREGEVGNNGAAYKVGNWFHVSADDCIDGVQVVFSANSETGVEVNAQLLDSSMQPLVESDFHLIQQADLTPIGATGGIVLPFSLPIHLYANTDYFVMVQHFGGADVRLGTSGYSSPHSSLLYNSVDSIWYSISTTPMVRMIIPGGKACWGVIDENDLEDGMILGACAPNPTTVMAQIQFTIKNPMAATLTLHDMNGKLLRTLADGPMGTGQHQVEVNTRNLEAGVYFYTLRTPTGMATNRMVVMH